MKKITFLFGMFAMLVIAACSTTKTTENLESYPVSKPLLIADTVYTNEYVADIEALQNVEIRARIKGHVEKLYVDEGQTVREGQLLFSISSKEFHQNLVKATAVLRSSLAELKSAQIELENTQGLTDRKIVAKTELEIMKAKVEALKASVEVSEAEKEQAELNLSFTLIKAPFNGIINRIPHKTGSLIEEGTLLTSISNNSQMLVYFNVSETAYLDYIKAKQDPAHKEVDLILADNSLYPQHGQIETIEGEFDKSTGNIAFRAKFPNPKQILKHGSSGKILVKKELKNALFIPQKATFEIQENIYVFLVDAQNKVSMKRIVPKLRMQNLYVIESGLTLEDHVLLEGIQMVKDGDMIRPNHISLQEAFQGFLK